jgi:hypothetical protein
MGRWGEEANRALFLGAPPAVAPWCKRPVGGFGTTVGANSTPGGRPRSVTERSVGLCPRTAQETPPLQTFPADANSAICGRGTAAGGHTFS